MSEGHLWGACSARALTVHSHSHLPAEIRIGLNEELSIGKSQLRGKGSTFLHPACQISPDGGSSEAPAVSGGHDWAVCGWSCCSFDLRKADGSCSDWFCRAAGLMFCWVCRLRSGGSSGRVQFPSGGATGRVRQPPDPPALPQPGGGEAVGMPTGPVTRQNRFMQ